MLSGELAPVENQCLELKIMLKAGPLSISRSHYSLCRGREKVLRGGGEIVVGEVQREEVR